ncbi:MAG: hypothetical protein JSS86_14425 [Cyanobacteria bacterium SZAS LIN-2]|nr:hypothetical protein [Cyanobacteria bacterium SZAS LIN-2]
MTEEPPQPQSEGAPTRLRQVSPAAVTAALLAIALAALTVRWYVGLEAPCYWSDFNYYEWATRFSISQLGQSPLTYPILLLTSVSLQHNLYFTVPLVPLMAVLGGDRAAFITSIALVYFLPLALAVALLANRLSGDAPNGASKAPVSATIKSFAVALLIPVLWAPTLRGYPDSGAALLLLITLLLYFDGRSFASARRGALIGFLLALTVLLRRYMAFAGVSLVVCIAVDQILTCRRSAAGTPTKTRIKTMLALIGGGAAGMVCLGYPFLLNLTRLNLGVLYESYHVSPSASVAYFFSCFGLITLALAAAGLLLTWRNSPQSRDQLLFTVIFYVIAQCLWILIPGELGTHYTLYFSPLVTLGVVLFYKAMSKNRAAMAATTLFLAFNLFCSLAPAKTTEQLGLKLFRPGMLSFADQEGAGPALLLSAAYPPNVRGDVDRLKLIVNQLRAHYEEAAQPGQAADSENFFAKRGHVGVIGCSNVLNHEILRNVERSIYGLNKDKIDWLEMPVVDSKDSYPLERLLACQYVVVPSVNQYFIAPAGQSIMAGSKACFDEKWPLANDFKLLPGALTIDGGVTVSVYERTRATTAATAALTLTRMKAFTPQEPGSQPNWITTGRMSQICYDKKRNQWEFKPALYRPGFFCEEDRYLLYSHDLPASFSLSGKLDSTPGVPPTILRAQLLGADGQLLQQVDLGETKEGVRAFDFIHDFGQVPMTGAAAPKYLVIVIDLAPQAMAPGTTITISDLKLEARH